MCNLQSDGLMGEESRRQRRHKETLSLEMEKVVSLK